MRAWRMAVVAAATGVAVVVGAVGPVGAEERTVPDTWGDTEHFRAATGDSGVVDRPDVDVVGTTVSYTDAGVRADVFTRAAPAPGVVVTHLLHLELPAAGDRHVVVLRANRDDVDVITEGPGRWRQDPCPAASHEQVGGRIAVQVPLACLPELASRTRFRLDSFLFEPPGMLDEQWWERVPAAGGFSLHRGARPAGAPDPAADGPIHDPSGVEGSVLRLYRVALGRIPDAGGMAHWLRSHWSGRALAAIAGDLASSPESEARFGATSDDAFVRALYQRALGRDPDPAGHQWWVAQLRRGVPRGAVMLHIAESPEVWARTAGDLPQGYRSAG